MYVPAAVQSRILFAMLFHSSQHHSVLHTMLCLVEECVRLERLFGNKEKRKKCEFYDGHCHFVPRITFNIFISSFQCRHRKNRRRRHYNEKPNVITRCKAIQRGKTEYDARTRRHTASMPTQISLYFCAISMFGRVAAGAGAGAESFHCRKCCCFQNNLCSTLRHSLCVYEFYYLVFTVSIRLLIISLVFFFLLPFYCSNHFSMRSASL